MKPLQISILVVVGVATASLAESKIPTGCPKFVVDLPHARGETVVKAADYGFATDNTNNVEAIARALAVAKLKGAAQVVLGAGTYLCYCSQGIDLNGFTDLTLDGQGAKLVFRRPFGGIAALPSWARHPETANIRIRNCERVLVKDLDVDWDWSNDPLGSRAKVVAAQVAAEDNQSYVDFEIAASHPAYPRSVPLIVAEGMNKDYTAFRKSPVGWFAGGSPGHFGMKNEWLSPTLLRVYPRVKQPNRYENPIHDGIFTAQGNRGMVANFAKDIGGAYRLLHYYYGEDMFALEGNRHLTLQRVHVLGSRGMGFIVQGRQHHWRLEDCSVAPPEGSGRIVSSTADADHVAQSQGWCQLVNCRFNFNEDDANNFHDRTTLALKRGKCELEVVNSRGAVFFGAEIGDELELLNADFSTVGWKGRIVAIDGNVYTMDRETPEPRSFCFILANRTYGTDNLWLSGCRFEHSGLRNLVHGRNVTIEKCYFKGMRWTPLRFLAVWTLGGWCEGTGCGNVVVRDCIFDHNNCTGSPIDGKLAEIATFAFTPEPYGVKTLSPALVERIKRWFPDGKVAVKPSSQAIADILVERCTFINPIELTWQRLTGDNLIERDNRVIKR